MAKPTKAKDAGKARIIKQGILTKSVLVEFILRAFSGPGGPRFRGRGAPRDRKIRATFRADLEAHPVDSVRGRAKRLGISRTQVDRLLAEARLNPK